MPLPELQPIPILGKLMPREQRRPEGFPSVQPPGRRRTAGSKARTTAREEQKKPAVLISGTTSTRPAREDSPMGTDLLGEEGDQKERFLYKTTTKLGKTEALQAGPWRLEIRG